MKLSVFRKIFWYISISVFFLSCDKNDNPIALTQAKDLAESDPAKALELLNSISDPEGLEYRDYMQYITMLVYTKREMKQDIKNDSLIFTAQQYFNAKNDSRLTPLVNFAAAWVQYKNGKPDKAIQSFMISESKANEYNNTLLAAKSSNNIGYIYFEQDIMDSAIVYYKKSYHSLVEANDYKVLELQSIINIASCYEITKDYHNAYFYLNNGLVLGDKIGNNEYKSKILNNMGVVLYGKKEYDKSINYFYQALPITTNTTDSIKLYLNLARSYKQINQLDSTLHYNTLAKSRMSEIKDNYMLEAIYNTFSDYYKQTGNYKLALRYSELEKETNEKIIQENKAKELYQADKKFALQQTDKRIDIENERMTRYLIVTALIALFIIGLSLFIFGYMRRFFKNQMEDIILLRISYDYSMNKIKSINRSEEEYDDLEIKMILWNKECAFHTPMPDENGIIRRKDTLFSIEQPLSKFAKRSKSQNIEWAKDFFKHLINGNKMTKGLSNRQTFLFALFCNGFTNEEIAIILQISMDELRICQKELEIRLIKADFLSHIQINLLLYYEG